MDSRSRSYSPAEESSPLPTTITQSACHLSATDKLKLRGEETNLSDAGIRPRRRNWRVNYISIKVDPIALLRIATPTSDFQLSHPGEAKELI